MKTTAPAAFIALALLSATAAPAGILGSKHDLTRDEREVYNTETGAVCMFCHIPYGASDVPQEPRWAPRQKDTPDALRYSLHTWESRPGGTAAGKPGGGSLNCLSCHDGTIGPDIPYNLVVPGMNRAAKDLRRFGSAYRPSTGRRARHEFFGDHPVNAAYTPGKAGLAAQTAVRERGLSLFGAEEDRVECASCHNPHTTPNPFLLAKPVNDLCGACHEKRASGKHVLGASGLGDNHPVAGKPDPLRPGKKLSCATCHDPHASSLRSSFSRITRWPDNMCLLCHTKITVRPPVR